MQPPSTSYLKAYYRQKTQHDENHESDVRTARAITTIYKVVLGIFVTIGALSLLAGLIKHNSGAINSGGSFLTLAAISLPIAGIVKRILDEDFREKKPLNIEYSTP